MLGVTAACGKVEELRLCPRDGLSSEGDGGVQDGAIRVIFPGAFLMPRPGPLWDRDLSFRGGTVSPLPLLPWRPHTRPHPGTRKTSPGHLDLWQGWFPAL